MGSHSTKGVKRRCCCVKKPMANESALVGKAVANRRKRCNYNQGMSYTGIVENGKVTLPPGAHLPDGTKVRVEAVDPASDSSTLADSMKEFIGIFDDLPPDFAKNHDHYIHHRPKK